MCVAILGAVISGVGAIAAAQGQAAVAKANARVLEMNARAEREKGGYEASLATEKRRE